MSTVEPIYPTLELVREGVVERTIEIKGPDLHLGRLHGLDVVFEDTRVSRHHARIDAGPMARVSSSTWRPRHDPPERPEARSLPAGPAPRRGSGPDCRSGAGLPRSDAEAPSSLGGRWTVLETFGDLTMASLARRSSAPAAALQAVLEVIRSLGGNAGLNVAIGQALDGLMAVFPQAERFRGEHRARRDVSAAGGSPPPGCRGPARHQRHDPCPGRERGQGRAHLRRCRGRAIRRARKRGDQPEQRPCACPCPITTERLGMVQLDSRSPAHPFSAADLDLLAALAGADWRGRWGYWLLSTLASWAAAGEIQCSLLPPRPTRPSRLFVLGMLPPGPGGRRPVDRSPSILIDPGGGAANPRGGHVGDVGQGHAGR